MITLESLKEDFRNIGIKTGDTLFLRISYKAVGKVEGGPIVFLKALHEVVGEEGTIILTAFPTLHIKQYYYFHKKKITSKQIPVKPHTGLMSIMALTYPKACLSKKLEFPFVVIGKHAEYLTNLHTHDMPPYWLLEEAIDKFDCKCLRVGGKEFTGSTHIALTRVLAKTGNYHKKLQRGIYVKNDVGVEWHDVSGSLFCYNAFIRASQKYVWEHINRNKATIGEGEATLTNMRETLHFEEKYMLKDVRNLLCSDKDCFLCRVSYSFSDTSKIRFLFRELGLLFTSKAKRGLRNIFNLVLVTFYGKEQR